MTKTAIDFEPLLQHMSEGFLAVDAAGIVLAANNAAATILQRSMSDMKGAALSTVVPDLAGSNAAGEIEKIGQGTVARRIQHFTPGRYTWFEILVVPRPTGMYLFIRNVTDRVRQQETAAVREAVRAIVRDAPVAISISRGAEHRYELMNEMSRQLVGDRDLEGRTVRNAFPELAESPLIDLMDDVYRTGVPYTGRNVSVTFDRKGDGNMVEGVFDITYQPLFELDGRVSGILTVAIDVGAYHAAALPE